MMIALLGLNIGKAVGSVLKGMAGTALNTIASSFLSAVQVVLTWLWVAIGNSTAVHLGGAAFDRLFAVVGVIALVVIFMLFAIEVGMSALRHDAGGMMRALRGVVIATLGTILAIFAINELLVVTDAASNGIITATTGESLGTFGTSVMSYTALSSLANPMLIILMSFVVMVASFMIWFSLILRKILIILAAIFAPLAFSGVVAGFSNNWLKKWIEGTVAMIVSKLFLAIILVAGYYTFLYGAGNTSAGGVTSVAQAMGSATAGTLLLALAALAPWLAIKSIHFASDHMSITAGHAGTMTAGAQRLAQHGQKAMSLASGLGGVGAGAAAGGGGGGAASAGPTGPPGPSSTPPPAADPPPSTSPTSAGSALWDQVAANGYTVPKPANDAEAAAATRAGSKLWDEVTKKGAGQP